MKHSKIGNRLYICIANGKFLKLPKLMATAPVIYCHIVSLLDFTKKKKKTIKQTTMTARTENRQQ